MILSILKEQKDFTQSEREISDYILSHPLDIQEDLMDDLAKKTYSSKATIVRLCKKAGAKNYQDFKKQIEIEYREDLRVEKLLEEEPVTRETSYDEVLEIIPALYDSSIVATKQRLNQNDMNRIINKLLATKHMSLYGTGITYTLALQSAFKFQSLGIDCHAYNGLNEHSILSSHAEDVSILMTISGENPEILKIASFLKKYHQMTIGIGDVKGVLKEMTDYYLPIEIGKDILSMEVMTSCTSIMYVLDVLFTMYLIRTYDQNVETSLRVIKDHHETQVSEKKEK